jgi:hypothetical protein
MRMRVVRLNESGLIIGAQLQRGHTLAAEKPAAWPGLC